MVNKTIKEFADILAAKAPTPGGGGASALAGALAIALGSMVGEYTIGNKKYADVEEKIKADLHKATNIRQSLLALIDEDAKAFEPLSRAYAIPKDDPSRGQILEAATLEALKPPLEIVRVCAQAMSILRDMQLYGSKMLISDAGCGASLCKAAMECAAMNVFINTKSLNDRQMAKKIEAEIDELLGKSISLADTIVSEVMSSVRG